MTETNGVINFVGEESLETELQEAIFKSEGKTEEEIERECRRLELEYELLAWELKAKGKRVDKALRGWCRG